jgi:hypothetical protein
MPGITTVGDAILVAIVIMALLYMCRSRKPTTFNRGMNALDTSISI